MPLTIESFKPYHLELLRVQGPQQSQVRVLSLVPAGYASVGRPPGPALTVRDGSTIILSGGIMTVDYKVGILWAALSQKAGPHMLWLTRATKRFVEANPMRRLEATVVEGFEQGCRWIRLLGFSYEGQMPGYGDEGETHLRFGKVRTC